ncbi:MAG: DUF1592 domain-containing protein, partial [Planctomycetia bacterium]
MNRRRPFLLSSMLATAVVFLFVTVGDRPDAALPSAAAAPAEAAKRVVVPFDAKVRPFLAKYCIDCHGADEPAAGLDLDHYKTEAGALKDRDVWNTVLDRVANGDMPPKDSPQPPKPEVADLTGWVDGTVNYVDCTGAIDPGHVTIRRLNRTEYDNTIRDLLAIDLKPADEFPSDDVGYGFDNIGDVLSMPPLLLEKYLAAAEKVLDRAIVTPDGLKPAKLELPASSFDVRGAPPLVEGRFRSVHQGAEAAAHQDLATTGEYVVKIAAKPAKTNQPTVKLAVSIDGSRLGEPIEIDGDAPPGRVYRFQGSVPAAGRKRIVVQVEAGPPPKSRDEKTADGKAGKKAKDAGRPTEGSLLIAGLQLEGPVDRAKTALPESHKRIFIRRPGDGVTVADAAQAVVGRFASRAYRRPATPDEVERLKGLVVSLCDEGLPFETAVQQTLQAVLVSPHFLFRIENDDAVDPSTVRTLDDFELATRLSYFLWSSMPDDALFRDAVDGTLRRNLDAQVQRMLASPKSMALVENFLTQWLQIRNLATAMPNRRRFTDWDEPLRQAMAKETELFFRAVMKEDRSVLDLLAGDYTFVNERLAKHYGLSGVRGGEFQKVSLKDTPRAGILTQASVLTVTSNPTRTSPVKRGKWVLEQLLGTPPPPAPPNVPALADDKQKGPIKGTLRQRLEQHRADPACASCHARMDPLGFGLENFDAIGAWRTQDGGAPIDASGVLPGGKKFSGPADLRTVLLDRKDDFLHCFAEKLLTYA